MNVHGVRNNSLRLDRSDKEIQCLVKKNNSLENVFQIDEGKPLKTNTNH